MELAEFAIHAWLKENEIKNEKGDPIDFKDHPFLFQIYDDRSQELVVMKAAQVGLSTLEVIKTLYDAKQNKMDIIYTLPTDEDVRIFVGGKVNRIIGQNPILLEYTKDKDSIELKNVGESVIYFRGTWSKSKAIMVTADRVTSDEKDSSKQDVVSEYQARLQHSKYKQRHTFSHPSATGTGVHVEWMQSDQKHWFISCPHCKQKQFLSWSTTDESQMSIDLEERTFICKSCKGILTDNDRRRGVWVRKYKDRAISGYWVSLLMCPWVTAGEIIDKYNDPESTEEFFFNKVLGLPYVGKGNKLTREALMSNLTEDIITPAEDERIVIGVDTGLRLDYVMGSKNGLFYHGDCKDYAELDKHMTTWKKAVAIVDAGGDLIGSRAFQERWRGRVFLGMLGGPKKNSDEPMWNDEEKMVSIDRSKYIQIVVDEFSAKRIPLFGTEEDWDEYWLDWNNLTRKKVTDPITGEFKGYKWLRSGRDHRALATVFWRVGMGRFGKGGGKLLGVGPLGGPARTASIQDGRIAYPKNSKLGPQIQYPQQNENTDWRRTD